MRKYFSVLIAVVVVIAAALFFYSRSAKRSDTSAAGVSMSATGEPAAFAGEVVETMNSGGYTYVRVKTGQGDVWAAGPETPVEVGDDVTMPAGMKMEGFKSETLNREFDTVYFVSEIRVGGAGTSAAGAKMPAGHPPIGSSSTTSLPPGVDLTDIEIPEGGTSIAALYADKDALEGKEVLVCGKVVKFTPAVMGKNWIHLRDGTGAEGTNDIAVTTDGTAEIGDLVTARGTVVLDRDFGFGYKYVVLIENAEVNVD
jgi:hypothetical protein